MTFVIDGKRMRFRKELRIAFWTVVTVIAVILMAFIFMTAVLQGSFKYFPATPEEIGQMNIVERWFFAK